ncbi:hypothetical protein PVAND_012648 [Polypedilum vanderplanki]|nr:hypothetical protein PVAND_012648 [Polypedilum vanderplanki]
MIVVLPKRGLSLIDVINNISVYGIKTLLIELKKSKEENKNLEVEVHLPRFEINTSLNLKETLKDLEINEIFENTANLSGINYNYYVSSILHKTKINVDEKGSEAPTVTNLISANKVKFYANRPFIYFILDKATRLILFAGVFKNPAVF